jgi:nicotinamidase-related amidase
MPLTLLVVGMQKDKVSAMTRGGEENDKRSTKHNAKSDTICGDVNQCIDFAMKNGWKVVFAMDMHHRGHSSFYVNGGTLRTHCVIGTMGYDPVTGLRFCENGMDIVWLGTEKDGDSSDAFWDIAKTCGSRLHSMVSDGLVVCGTSPDGCIENTIATAQGRGIPVHIVGDAVWLLGEMPAGARVLNLSSMGSC